MSLQKGNSFEKYVAKNYSFTEDELTRVINKTLEQILRPNCSTSERKRLSFDLKRLLQGLFLSIFSFVTFIGPVYTGDVNPLINMIDLNFVNDLIDTKFKLGITHAEKLTESEISLLQEYQEIRKLWNKNLILKGFWQTIDLFYGSQPSSWEGAKLIAENGNLYLYGGFSRDAYGEMR